MTKFKGVFAFLGLCLALSGGMSSARADDSSGILHIEYFAGNYANKVMHDPKVQFEILFETAQRLAKRFGPSGTIYINDIEPLAAKRAAEALKSYLKEKGYTKIKVLEAPGDVLEMEIPKTKTAHLKNPEPFFLKQLDRSVEAERLRKQFTRLIESSDEGLIVHTFELGLRPQDLENYLEGLNEHFGATRTAVLKYSYFEPRKGSGIHIAGPVGSMIELHFPTQKQKAQRHCVMSEIESLFRDYQQ